MLSKIIQKCFKRSPIKYKKIPQRILILAPEIKYFPTLESEVYFHPSDKKYDLVVIVGEALRLNTEYPFSISESEIWFERGKTLTKEIFENAITHYSNCEIRNGR